MVLTETDTCELDVLFPEPEFVAPPELFDVIRILLLLLLMLGLVLLC